MRTILIVDDDASMRFLLKMLFESAGYQVVESSRVRATRSSNPTMELRHWSASRMPAPISSSRT